MRFPLGLDYFQHLRNYYGRSVGFGSSKDIIQAMVFVSVGNWLKPVSWDGFREVIGAASRLPVNHLNLFRIRLCSGNLALRSFLRSN
jgi:hypothetical protein